MTYEKVEGTRRFKLIARYRVENGTYADGAPAINALGYYEHGIHFLIVAGDWKPVVYCSQRSGPG